MPSYRVGPCVNAPRIRMITLQHAARHQKAFMPILQIAKLLEHATADV